VSPIAIIDSGEENPWLVRRFGTRTLRRSDATG
jgi:hypothetical protein